MAVRILIGATHRDREALLLEALVSAFDVETRTLDALILVPTRFRARSLREAILRRFDGRCWLPLVLTFEELYERHAFEIVGSGRHVEVEARLRLIEDLLTRLPLILRRGRMTRGLLRAIEKTVAWMREELLEPGASIDALSAAIQPESESLAADLAELERRYGALMEGHRLVDEAGRVARLIETWKRGGFSEPHRYLVLDGFDSLSTARRAVLETLLPFFSETLITLAVPDEGLEGLDSHPAFVKVRLLLEFLERYTPQKMFVPPSNSGGTPAEVARRLFQRHTTPLTLPDAGESTFRLLRCANRREEVRTVARLIRQRLGKSPENADFTRFTVVVPAWRPYQGLVDEVFREYGLPATVSRGVPLVEIPALRRVAKALNALTPGRDGWTPETIRETFATASLPTPEPSALAERVARLLRRPVDLSSQRCPFCLSRFDELVRRAGITEAFHAESWFDRVALYLESGADEENARPTWLEENQPNETILQFAQDIAVVEGAIQAFEGLLSKGTPESFAEELSGLCKRLGIVRQTQPLSSLDALERREFSGWSAFTEILAQMQEAFRLLEEVTGRPFDAVAFAEALAQAITDGEYECFPPRPELGVRVLSTAQVVEETYEHLFVVGMVEGEFPRVRDENFYLAPDVSRWGNPSVIALDPLPTERFRFRELLRNAQNVVLTYPAMEGGKPVSRSPFVEDVLDLFGASGSEEVAPLREDERAPLLSVREVLAEMGRRANVVGAERLPLRCANVPVLLRTEVLRARRDLWSSFDGYLSPTPAIRAVLETHTAKPYSVGVLEEYAQCPIRYFFARVLGLRAVEAFRGDVAPHVRGTIVHEILERFYRNLNADVTDLSFDRRAAGRRMLAVAKETLRRYDVLFPNLYWEEERHLLLRGLDDEKEEPGLLAAFLDVEFSPTAYPVVGRFRRSVYAELRIGEGGDTPLLTLPRRDGSGAFAIRGRIDRVDVEWETGKYVVLDYKTGATPLLKWTKEGYRFQLPVYLLALEGYRGVCTKGVGAAFYHLRRPGEVGIKEPLILAEEASSENRSRSGQLPHEAFRAFLARTESRLAEIDDHIRNGRFHWTLADEGIAGCRFCDYRASCRMNPSRRDGFSPTQPHYAPHCDETATP